MPQRKPVEVREQEEHKPDRPDTGRNPNREPYEGRWKHRGTDRERERDIERGRERGTLASFQAISK